MSFTRPNDRLAHQIRPVTLQTKFTKHAEGSVLISTGDTKVICNATVEYRVPRFLKNTGKGWITAEYSMLPRATDSRTQREAARGKQSGRTLEIQRLIGRSLRAAVDLEKLGEHTITVDCDVIQADGGTRTAAITGGFVALSLAIQHMLKNTVITQNPIIKQIAATSVGIVDGVPLVDLEYVEDSRADTDMNIVMDEATDFIEIQGTAEQQPFTRSQLDTLFDLATQGIKALQIAQNQALLNG